MSYTYLITGATSDVGRALIERLLQNAPADTLVLAQGCGGDAVLIALLIVLSLTLALYLFLSEYLLYRYDHDDLPTEDFDESED